MSSSHISLYPSIPSPAAVHAAEGPGSNSLLKLDLFVEVDVVAGLCKGTQLSEKGIQLLIITSSAGDAHCHEDIFRTTHKKSG